jgi:hypothetical protein
VQITTVMCGAVASTSRRRARKAGSTAGTMPSIGSASTPSADSRGRRAVPSSASMAAARSAGRRPLSGTPVSTVPIGSVKSRTSIHT